MAASFIGPLIPYLYEVICFFFQKPNGTHIAKFLEDAFN
jgi:hypothetical protein